MEDELLKKRKPTNIKKFQPLNRVMNQIYCKEEIFIQL